MSIIKTTSILGVAALVAKVSAHGIVQGIVADGVYYSGYSPSFQYQTPPPVVAGWSIPLDSDFGFVNNYTSPDIVCHIGATPGGAYVTVAAGDTVSLEWTVWPESHKGPVMDYLASCNGDCTTVDKTKLLFNKIDESGLIDGSPAPGTWASDTLIADNNTWTVTIPPTIAPGKYVLRHEIIALHSAYDLDGSQAYPQCVNLEITGSGTNTLPTGTVAQSFYKDTDPGLLINIYYPVLTNYTIPGPALIADAVSGSQPAVSASATATASSSATTAPALSTGTTSSKATIPTSVPYASSTSTTASKSSTLISSHVGAVSTTSTSSTVAAPTATSSSAVIPIMPSYPTSMSSAVSPTEASTATTFGISFTSTFTGRVGKPTKFTCYIDE